MLVAGQRVYDVATGHWQALAVTDGACGVVATYCTAGTTSGGCVPTISATGTPSGSTGSGFVVAVDRVDGQRPGLIFYGVSGRLALPWGSSTSWLCVKPPTMRSGVQSSGGTFFQCDGRLAVDWNAFVAANSGALGAPFTNGTHVYAQGWFRDPPSPKTSSLSDALEFLPCP